MKIKVGNIIGGEKVFNLQVWFCSSKISNDSISTALLLLPLQVSVDVLGYMAYIYSNNNDEICILVCVFWENKYLVLSVALQYS